MDETRRWGGRTAASPDPADPGSSPLETGTSTLEARCVETPLSSMEAEITPTDRFFIRSHFPVPQADPSTWRLTVDGDVEHPFTLSLPELREMPHREVVAVVECAGNSRASVRPRPEGVLWGHGAVSAARWRGVRLREILDRAGVRPGALEVLLEGADRGLEPGVVGEIGYGMSISVPKALHPDTLLADEMNGEPLAPSHGYPIRAVVPGWYGMASVKWLARVALLRHPYEGHFRSQSYVYIPEGTPHEGPKTPVTTTLVKSLITWPREGQVLSTGPHRVRGVAWSGDAPIRQVDVSWGPSAGPVEVWRPARLFPPASPHTWTHWELLGKLPTPGYYVIRVRATDGDGRTQPMHAEWNYRGVGNNSVQAVPIEVRADGPPDSP